MNSDFISIFDVMENNTSLTPVKDEIFAMKAALKQEMDKGLTPDEMKNAKIKESALLAAESILEKL